MGARFGGFKLGKSTNTQNSRKINPVDVVTKRPALISTTRFKEGISASSPKGKIGEKAMYDHLVKVFGEGKVFREVNIRIA